MAIHQLTVGNVKDRDKPISQYTATYIAYIAMYEMLWVGAILLMYVYVRRAVQIYCRINMLYDSNCNTRMVAPTVRQVYAPWKLYDAPVELQYKPYNAIHAL